MRLSLGVVSLLVSLLLVSCEPKDTTLTLGIFAGSNWGVPAGDSYRFYDDAIAIFEKANPRIKVRYRSGTLREDYSEWLAQKIVQGNEPDVMLVLAEDFNTYSSIGVLEDLAPLMAADPEFHPTSFYPPVLASGGFQGRQFALPVEIDPTLMFVNTSLLGEADVAIPKPDWTWEDFYSICQKVANKVDSDGGLERFGATRFSWRSLAFTDGWRPFSPQGTEAYFDTPGFIHTIDFVSKVRKLSRNQREPDFDSGKVAFAPDRFSNYRAYQYYPYRVKRFGQFNWLAMEMPRGPAGRNASELPTLLVGLSHRSAHRAEAWKLIKLLTADPEVQLGILRYSSGWPASVSAAEDSRVPDILRKNFPGTEGLIDVKVINAIVEKSITPRRFKRYDQVMDAADQELYRIIDDPFDLENRLHKLNQTINLLLKN